MTSFGSPKSHFSIEKIIIKLWFVLISALLLQSLLPALSHSQDDKIAKKIAIIHPKGGSFTSDDNIQISGTVDLAKKEHIWLIVKQIKSIPKKIVYLDEVKVDSAINVWNYRILLDKLELQNDDSVAPSNESIQNTIAANKKLLDIMVVVVNEDQHKKLRSHLIKKLKGIETKLVPPSIISKDQIEIAVQNN
jgi:hypothetical protein